MGFKEAFKYKTIFLSDITKSKFPCFILKSFWDIIDHQVESIQPNVIMCCH